MNNNLSLVVPTRELEHDAIAYKEEFFDRHEPIINGSALWDQTDSYAAWLQHTKNNSHKIVAKPILLPGPAVLAKTVQPGWVPASTFFAVRQQDHKIVGMIDIRHHIDHPFLSQYGGHIGFRVRPTERNKGYATQMLRQALAYCQDLGLAQVMLGCYKDNRASVRTIEKCGGVCAQEKKYTDGKPMLVFWINI
jgi:predicted acetyltransferase